VLEFDANGTLLNKWGGPGTGYDWPVSPGGIAVDAKGNVWITVKCPLDSRVSVEVTDDGPGIPPEQLGKIFMPFFTSKKHGTGLGLATCKRIVTNHGGNIQVQSEPAKGTRFTIELALNSRVLMSLVRQ